MIQDIHGITWVTFELFWTMGKIWVEPYFSVQNEIGTRQEQGKLKDISRERGTCGVERRDQPRMSRKWITNLGTCDFFPRPLK